jgi:hypothetical protein
MSRRASAKKAHIQLNVGKGAAGRAPLLLLLLLVRARAVLSTSVRSLLLLLLLLLPMTVRAVRSIPVGSLPSPMGLCTWVPNVVLALRSLLLLVILLSAA